MREKRKQMIVIAVLLALLTGIYGLLCLLPSDSEEGSESPAPLTLNSNLDLTSLTFETQEQSLTFVRQDGVWSLKNDPQFPLSQTLFSTVVSNWKNLTAQQQLENPDALADYGLDTPELTVRAADIEGQNTVMKFSSQQQSVRYGLCEDETDVYVLTTSAVENFLFQLEDLLELEEIPSIVRSDIQSVSIVSGQDVLMITRQADEAEERWLLSDSLTSLECSSEDLSSFFSVLTTLSAESCLDWKGDAGIAETHGLNHPQAVITVQYTHDDLSQQFTLEIGSVLSTDSTLQAVRLQGSSRLQTMNAASLKTLLAMTVESVRQTQQERVQAEAAEALADTGNAEADSE